MVKRDRYLGDVICGVLLLPFGLQLIYVGLHSIRQHLPLPQWHHSYFGPTGYFITDSPWVPFAVGVVLTLFSCGLIARYLVASGS